MGGETVRVGDKYIWTPTAWTGEVSATARGGKQIISRSITGRIIYIHPERRYFTVEAAVQGGTIRESIKIMPK